MSSFWYWCYYYLQDNAGDNKSSGASLSSAANVRRADLSLKIPPTPTFGNSRSGKALMQSPGAIGGTSSTGGFLRALSFKKKPAGAEGERSSLLSSDPKAAPESPVLANLVSGISWKRCTSLPVTHASHFSPTVSTPVSTRTVNESKRSHVSCYCGFASI